MSFRWLQFWCDVRQGIHPAWRNQLSDLTLSTPSEWIHHQHSIATQVREALQVSTNWDHDLKPKNARWLLLSAEDFDLWCQAVGLVSLGNHLRKIVSPKTMARMGVTLDRNCLATIVDFVCKQQLSYIKPLPLALPTARELGEDAIAAVCKDRFPKLWSRLRLRMEPDRNAHPVTSLDTAVFQLSFCDLEALDGILFDRLQQPNKRPNDIPEANDSWAQPLTLSA